MDMLSKESFSDEANQNVLIPVILIHLVELNLIGINKVL